MGPSENTVTRIVYLLIPLLAFPSVRAQVRTMNIDFYRNVFAWIEIFIMKIKKISLIREGFKGGSKTEVWKFPYFFLTFNPSLKAILWWDMEMEVSVLGGNERMWRWGPHFVRELCVSRNNITASQAAGYGHFCWCWVSVGDNIVLIYMLYFLSRYSRWRHFFSRNFNYRHSSVHMSDPETLETYHHNVNGQVGLLK